LKARRIAADAPDWLRRIGVKRLTKSLDF